MALQLSSLSLEPQRPPFCRRTQLCPFNDQEHPPPLVNLEPGFGHRRAPDLQPLRLPKERQTSGDS